MNEPTTVIQTDNLTRRFGLLTAVDALTLSVQRGEIFGLVGPDGAGKTTILRMLAAIMDSSEGRAIVAGFDTVKQAEAIKHRIGYMAQQFNLYGDLSVQENLDFYADVFGVRGRERRERTERLLRFARLTDFTGRRAANLSGGMKKKLALACALIHQPEILFLDEPTTGVDPISRREFWDILSELHGDGVSILVSTPYMDEAERCSRVGLMYQGRLVVCDTPEQIKRLVPGDLVELRPVPADHVMPSGIGLLRRAEAEHQAKAARLQAEAADLQNALWGRVTKMLQEGFDVSFSFGSFHVDKPAERDQANARWNVSGQEAWEAWQTAYAADDAVIAARTALGDLRRQRGSLIGLDAQVNQAEAAYRRALAGIDQARAAVQGLEEGATAEEIEVARQAVEQARAGHAALEVQQGKARVGAPLDGLVTQVVIHLGEVALTGAPLMEIADLREVTLKVYVSTPDMDRVRLGQPVQVTVDSFPDRVFEGRVTRIADQAEFTPKTVQTQAERVNSVFAVEISLANPDRALKPGMPADAAFSEPR